MSDKPFYRDPHPSGEGKTPRQKGGISQSHCKHGEAKGMIPTFSIVDITDALRDVNEEVEQRLLIADGGTPHEREIAFLGSAALELHESGQVAWQTDDDQRMAQADEDLAHALDVAIALRKRLNGQQ